MAGAEFTVKYYDNFDGLANIGKKAKRTWVLKTDGNGTAALANKSKVSGDKFYLDKFSKPCSPLGTLLIQETKAPKGYLLEDQILGSSFARDNGKAPTGDFKAPIHAMVLSQNGSQVKITMDGNSNQPITANHSPMVPEPKYTTIHFEWADGSKNLIDPLSKDTKFEYNNKTQKLKLPRDIIIAKGETATLPSMPRAKTSIGNDPIYLVPYGWYENSDRTSCVQNKALDIEKKGKYWVPANAPDEITLYVYYNVRYKDVTMYLPGNPV